MIKGGGRSNMLEIPGNDVVGIRVLHAGQHRTGYKAKRISLPPIAIMG